MALTLSSTFSVTVAEATNLGIQAADTLWFVVDDGVSTFSSSTRSQSGSLAADSNNADLEVKEDIVYTIPSDANGVLNLQIYWYTHSASTDAGDTELAVSSALSINVSACMHSTQTNQGG